MRLMARTESMGIVSSVSVPDHADVGGGSAFRDGDAGHTAWLDRYLRLLSVVGILATTSECASMQGRSGCPSRDMWVVGFSALLGGPGHWLHV